MAEGLNRVLLLGNLGADPELRVTPGGQAVLKLRLATNESYSTKPRPSGANRVASGHRLGASGRGARQDSSRRATRSSSKAACRRRATRRTARSATRPRSSRTTSSFPAAAAAKVGAGGGAVRAAGAAVPNRRPAARAAGGGGGGGAEAPFDDFRAQGGGGGGGSSSGERAKTTFPSDSWPDVLRRRESAGPGDSKRPALRRRARGTMLPGRHEGRYSPRLPRGARHLRLRQHLRHAFHPRRLPGRRLRRLPPVLHGHAEAHRHRGPRRSLPQALREEGAIAQGRRGQGCGSRRQRACRRAARSPRPTASTRRASLRRLLSVRPCPRSRVRTSAVRPSSRA